MLVDLKIRLISNS